MLMRATRVVLLVRINFWSKPAPQCTWSKVQSLSNALQSSLQSDLCAPFLIWLLLPPFSPSFILLQSYWSPCHFSKQGRFWSSSFRPGFCTEILSWSQSLWKCLLPLSLSAVCWNVSEFALTPSVRLKIPPPLPQVSFYPTILRPFILLLKWLPPSPNHKSLTHCKGLPCFRKSDRS